jgi:hypothetical protein
MQSACLKGAQTRKWTILTGRNSKPFYLVGQLVADIRDEGNFLPGSHSARN